MFQPISSCGKWAVLCCGKNSPSYICHTPSHLSPPPSLLEVIVLFWGKLRCDYILGNQYIGVRTRNTCFPHTLSTTWVTWVTCYTSLSNSCPWVTCYTYLIHVLAVRKEAAFKSNYNKQTNFFHQTEKIYQIGCALKKNFITLETYDINFMF